MSAEKKANSEKPSTPDRVDPLTVGPVIKPLGKLKRAHNKLVNLIRTITCKGGLKVSISDGRLIFDASKITGVSDGAAIDVVGDVGTLNKVPKHSTWSSPTAFPTVLGCGATGSSPNTRMTDAGMTVTGSSPNRTAVVAVTSFHAIHNSNYQAFIGADPSSGGVFVQNNSHSLDIVIGAITRNMSIKEIDVCDGGVAKKMLVIASDPY
jgi:hypothetical protein